MVFLVIILLLLGLLPLNSLDPDFGWHLYLGKNIVESRHLINSFVGYSNFQNISIPDHEWLSDIILYLIYTEIGYWFLAILCIAIFLIIIKLLFSLCFQKTNNLYITILALLPFLLSSNNLLHGIRLQLLLVLAAVLLVFIYEREKRYKIRLFYYFLIFLIGNNFHGGMMMLAIIPALLESQMFFLSDKNNLKRKLVALMVLTLILLTALSINPYGISIWKLAFDYGRDNYYKNHISEWMPAFIPPIRWFSSLLPFTLVIFIFFITQRYRKVSLPEAILLFIFLILSIRFVRFFALFLAIASPYIAQSLNDFVELVKFSKRRLNILATAAAISTIFFLLTQINFVLLNSNPFDNVGYPKNALFHLSAYPDKHNLFNTYEWGGYLLWTRPNDKVFIDGRAPQARIGPNKTLLMECNDFFAKGRTEEMLNKYQINSVLIKKEEIKHYNVLDRLLYKMVTGSYPSQTPPPNYLSQYLDDSNAWQKVYEDNLALIYFKKD